VEPEDVPERLDLPDHRHVELPPDVLQVVRRAAARTFWPERFSSQALLLARDTHKRMPQRQLNCKWSPAMQLNFIT
jgi:hypothetical protein